MWFTLLLHDNGPCWMICNSVKGRAEPLLPFYCRILQGSTDPGQSGTGAHKVRWALPHKCIASCVVTVLVASCPTSSSTLTPPWPASYSAQSAAAVAQLVIEKPCAVKGCMRPSGQCFWFPQSPAQYICHVQHPEQSKAASGQPGTFHNVSNTLQGCEDVDDLSSHRLHHAGRTLTLSAIQCCTSIVFGPGTAREIGTLASDWCFGALRPCHLLCHLCGEIHCHRDQPRLAEGACLKLVGLQGTAL